MSLTIPAHDHGQLRVFALDFAPPDALKLKTTEGLAGSFGVILNPAYVDVIDIAALGEMSLKDYVKQGYDFDLDPADTAALSELQGWVVIVMSRATAGAETTLDLTPGLRHVTTIGTQMTLNPQAPLESDAAKGVLTPPTKKPMSDARIGGMIATLALLVLFALVAVMIWVAG